MVEEKNTKVVESIITELKTELVTGYVKEIKPRIYAVVVNDDYDRAMLFCRYQEFYESPYKKINGKYFTLQYFMKHYMKKRGHDVFRYHRDWSGFNLPSEIFDRAINVFCGDNDEYNNIMKIIYSNCVKYTTKNYNENDKFYVIGVDKLRTKLTKHEIAHGFYYTDSDYRHNMNLLVDSFTAEQYGYLEKQLTDIGYSKKKQIIYDEIQAYLSTESFYRFKRKDIIEKAKKFEKIYKKYYNKKI